MDELRIRPMKSSEFDALRSRLIVGYAAEHVRAGDWRADEADELATRETERLVPNGVETPGMLFLTAETAAGDLVGHVWVALDVRPGSASGAWIYDIEIEEGQRGHGYGRALLMAAEREVASHGVGVIGLNAFGTSTVARSLYDSSGYEITALQMRKRLSPTD
jgi:GNAT superfamily N-acetyltransferase